ncbi:P-aminobenzoate N-oxygenase AurF [Mycobacteroides abscessus subsp. abscessus]|nr:P-aminobenzoate N-oxygenase AurF [Mycobacteroides abscessus subsp. abscessus]
MTEECNHIQMFQELVNRIGDDVPGMRPISICRSTGRLRYHEVAPSGS